MRVKKVEWTSRRKKKAGPGRYEKMLIPVLIVFAVLAAWHQVSVYYPDGDQASGSDSWGEAAWEKQHSLSAAGSFLLRIMSSHIPGMPVPAASEKDDIQAAAMDIFKSLTGIDPRDPGSFLTRELGMVSPVYLPDPDPPGDGAVSLPGDSEDGDGSGDPELRTPQEDLPVFNPSFPLFGLSEPIALVHHTHATESFVPTSGVTYTTEEDYNVVRLGRELVNLLSKQYGLPLIHECGIYDLPRVQAYEKSRPVVQKILSEHSQMDFVIDLHRDGVRRELTTTVINGDTIGRILIVVGSRHPQWESNYIFALRLQRELETVAPGLSRGILKQRFGYNQDLHPNSLIIEVGGHENTMEEARLAVPFLAEALARAYYALFVQN